MKRWFVGLVISMFVTGAFAQEVNNVSWEASDAQKWMVFDVKVKEIEIEVDVDNPKKTKIQSENETLVLVVNMEDQMTTGTTNRSTLLVDIDKGEDAYGMECATDILFFEVSEKEDKDGNDISAKQVLSLTIPMLGEKYVVLGPTTWSCKRNKDADITSEKISMSLKGAKLQYDESHPDLGTIFYTDGASYATVSARYNAKISAAMNEGTSEEAYSTLVQYVKKTGKIKSDSDVNIESSFFFVPESEPEPEI